MRLVKQLSVLFLSIVILITYVSCNAESAPQPTATPEPLSITRQPEQPPDVILDMMNIAYNEWENLHGTALKKSNKYTKWVNDAEWGWCAGFTSWCAREAGVPQAGLNDILKMPEGESDSVFSCSAVQHMHRTTMIPQKGFIILYGDRTNCTVHVGLVWDVQQLENGKYRLITIEGNMKSTVRMFIADYEPVDVYYEQGQKPKVSNLSAVPEEDRTDWYVTCFLMTWMPEGDYTVVDEEVYP